MRRTRGGFACPEQLVDIEWVLISFETRSCVPSSRVFEVSRVRMISEHENVVDGILEFESTFLEGSGQEGIVM